MKLKHYILFTLIIGLFTTCKKFPEDPFISLRTVKSRLTGKWKFESIIYNGNEIKALYNDSLNPNSFEDEFLQFTFDIETSHNKSSNYYEKYNQLGITIPNTFTNYTAGLKFYINKKSITFTNSQYVGGLKKLNKIFLENPSFEIGTLYRSKLKIKNDLYEIKLTKIK